MNGWWAEPPAVRVCAGSGVTRTRIQGAIDYWERLGYEFRGPWMDDGSPICRGDGLRGEIQVMIVNNDVPIGDNLAVTRTYTDRRTGEIQRAQVYLFPANATKPYLLEHELGHALGWAHFNRYLHVMNRDYREVGSDSTGLRSDARDREIERLQEKYARNRDEL